MAAITNVRSSVICSIPMEYPVKGVAPLGSRLCVLLSRNFDQIEIFELTDNNEYRKQSTISVPGLRSGDVEDMAACAQDDCLYITDSTKNYVNRIKMEGDPIQWVVCKHAEDMRPIGVSVTAANNVLVTCHRSTDGAVMEFTTRGDRVRTIKLKGQCRKAIELPPDKFVVCYAQCRSLRIINSSGDVVWSNDDPSEVFMGIMVGGWSAQLQVDVLDFALDTDGFIFVSDVRERTVISISANSTVRRVLLAFGCGLKGEPGKMCFEPANRRLFVVDMENLLVGKVNTYRTRIVVMHVIPLSW